MAVTTCSQQTLINFFPIGEAIKNIQQQPGIVSRQVRQKTRNRLHVNLSAAHSYDTANRV